MLKDILTKVGQILKDSWKYIPIGCSYDEFTRKDLDLDNPWHEFRFGMKNTLSLAVLAGLIWYGVEVNSKIDYTQDRGILNSIKKTNQKFKDLVLTNIPYFQKD